MGVYGNTQLKLQLLVCRPSNVFNERKIKKTNFLFKGKELQISPPPSINPITLKEQLKSSRSLCPKLVTH